MIGIDKIKPEGSNSNETIHEENDGWFWEDGVGEWHGPYSSKQSAQSRQSLYCADLVGRYNFVTRGEWEARKRLEKEGTIHPCNKAEPWDCDCAGSCSCHWSEE